MARAITLAVVFFLCFNLFSGVLISTGAADTLGLDAQVGADEETSNLVNCKDPNAQNPNECDGDVPTGSPSSGTLFGLYNVVGGFLSGIYNYIFPGLTMMERAGVPTFITDDILGNLFALLITIGVAAFVRGYDI